MRSSLVIRTSAWNQNRVNETNTVFRNHQIHKTKCKMVRNFISSHLFKFYKLCKSNRLMKQKICPTSCTNLFTLNQEYHFTHPPFSFHTPSINATFSISHLSISSFFLIMLSWFLTSHLLYSFLKIHEDELSSFWLKGNLLFVISLSLIRLSWSIHLAWVELVCFWLSHSPKKD